MSNKNKKLAQEWFERAESDLKYAKAGEKETGEHHITCFLCHQAAEKFLKGLIVLGGDVPQKTHNLSLLISAATSNYPSISDISKEIRKLDKFYMPARYPGGVVSEFTPDDAKFALVTSKKLLDIAYAEIA